jgi:hypothetical protein
MFCALSDRIAVGYDYDANVVGALDCACEELEAKLNHLVSYQTTSFMVNSRFFQPTDFFI